MCLITIVLKRSVLIQPLLKFQKPQTLTSSLNPTITVCFTHQLEDLQFLLIWGNSNVFFFFCFVVVLFCESTTPISVSLQTIKHLHHSSRIPALPALFSTKSAWLQSLFFFYCFFQWSQIWVFFYFEIQFVMGTSFNQEHFILARIWEFWELRTDG